ncbi:polysaccharide deacetylase family protein [Streptosporangium sp. NBC_01810]|uniref:polysaccharide deacetylase family protein n=1 Tax=Streptosporangium sp. NBC_01810 TaxID=2975951 RepID=UPI002DDC15DF|nr:polysaccharide deacetylase family protein [Streptosporangium sp. NBC_01810]WSA24765.1 polysaccharide deacetylase family protein [Streptosporangium sp. NBC_01810]
MPNLRFVGGIAWMAVTIAGCGAAITPSSAKTPMPSEPTLINYVDPSVVQGLSTQTLFSGEAGNLHAHAAYPIVTDAPLLTKKLHGIVREGFDGFTRRNGLADALPKPEFNVDWQLAAASPEVLGIRLRIGHSKESGWHEARTTVWYDRVKRRALDSSDLLTGRPALVTLAGIVKSELALRRPLVNPNALRPDREMFDSLGFNPRGGLVVEFDDEQVGLGVAGRVAVAVPSATAAPLLSEIGLRAQRTAVAAKKVPAPTSREEIEAASTDKPPARSSKAGSVDCAKLRCVALTYNDGPGPETARLLDILRAHGARATFFTLGSNASTRPDLLRRIRDEGHLVANHTWSHRDLTMLTPTEIADQLTRAQHAIAPIIGQAPTLVRPPYAGVDTQVASIASRLNMAVVRWNVDPDDQQDRPPRAIADRTVTRVEPGAIVLMHDSHPAAVDAVPEILRRLSAAGYTFVTVPELYGSRGMVPGRIYDSGGVSTALDR